MTGVYERKKMSIVCVKIDKTALERKKGTNGKAGEKVAMACWEDGKMKVNVAGEEGDEDELNESNVYVGRE